MSDSFSDAMMRGDGRGVTIGILDTGINDLPGFEDCLKGHFRVEESDRKLRIEECGQGDDRISHGTTCADIIHRYAPGADLFDVRVLDYKVLNSRYKLAAGIRFGMEKGWDILNLCVGSHEDFARLREITREALARGTIIVAAIDGDIPGGGYPAAYPGVISVDHDYLESPLEIRPSNAASVCGHGVYVEARNAAGEVESFTGSSFASPHVTALLARVRPLFPEMNGGELLERCLESQPISPLKKTDSPR